ncbi:MAG: PIN domain-containing protein [Lamprocystis purpurea]|jgi:predicted nucleic acid-binding protein|uniref:PIN domain-containing protein n=1 Tax=Lamprocystis purpurea TaxID=61598 RepID=UPI00036DD032|nr:PIN domain-containing protein [Lamprocystis purpurea]MBV5273336.1 PIN domain-containing protein [Lamprocystis purpurea]
MSVDFLDSNVFLYAFDRKDPRKRTIAKELIREGLQRGDAAISHQVVQETLNVLTGKLKAAAGPDEARRFLHAVLIPFWRVMPTPEFFQRGIAVQERYGFHFYDSLIVAAALEAGCARLLSEDLQHGQRIETLTVENPFL